MDKRSLFLRQTSSASVTFTQSAKLANTVGLSPLKIVIISAVGFQAFFFHFHETLNLRLPLDWRAEYHALLPGQ
jgi:uncharacterized membrane protein